MPTTNPRVNITFDPATVAILLSLAKQEHLSLSSLTKELVLEALDRREDRVLSAIAETRDHKTIKTISHDDAWK
jgi:hypothetical protein